MLYSIYILRQELMHFFEMDILINFLSYFLVVVFFAFTELRFIQYRKVAVFQQISNDTYYRAFQKGRSGWTEKPGLWIGLRNWLDRESKHLELNTR